MSRRSIALVALVTMAAPACSRTAIFEDHDTAETGSSGSACPEEKAACCEPASGALEWAKSFGDAEDQLGTSVDVDEQGNAWLAGKSWGAIDLGGGPMNGPGLPDLFVGKFEPGGAHAWSRSFGGAATDSYVAAAPGGGVVLAGSHSGELDFGGGTNPVGDLWDDIFLARLDATGHHVWSRFFGAENDDWVSGLSVGSSGNVTVIGRILSDAVDLGGGPIGHTDFIASFDAEGAYRWHHTLDDAWPGALATDASGNIHVVGWSRQDAGGTIVEGPWAAKLDADGNTQYSRVFPETSYLTMIHAVTVDPAGNTVFPCDCPGVDFGDGAIAAGDTLAIVTLDANGQLVRKRAFAGARALDIAADACGDVVVTGSYFGDVDFGGGPLHSVAAGDVFVAKLDGAGDHLWSTSGVATGAAESDLDYNAGQSISVAPNGDVWIAGWFAHTIDLAGTELTAAGETGQGQRDVLLAKLRR